LVSSFSQIRLVCEFDEESQRLIGDALFGIVEVDTLGLGAQSFSALRVLSEERPQVRRVECALVSFERQPGASLAKRECGHGMFLGVSSRAMASLHLLSLATF